MRAIYGVLAQTLVTRSRLLALGGLGLVAVVIGAAQGAADLFDPIRSATRLIDAYGLSLFAPVGSRVFAAAAHGDPAEDGTLVYLWLRPVRRTSIVGAAFAASLTVALPVTVVPLVLASLLSSGEAELVVGTVLSAAVAVVAYCALFVWLGLRTRRSLVWGLAYILIWEGFVARAGDNAARFAVRAYSRSILSELTDVPLRLAEISFGAALVVPLVVAAAALALASRRLARQDVA
jgi:ABC-2 type transport system permease protein